MDSEKRAYANLYHNIIKLSNELRSQGYTKMTKRLDEMMNEHMRFVEAVTGEIPDDLAAVNVLDLTSKLNQTKGEN